MAMIIIKKLSSACGFKRLAGSHSKKAGLRSGLVSLKPGKSVGSHTSSAKEEALIILSGKARITFGTRSKTAGCGSFVFIPSDTIHDVTNCGRGRLRYVYVTASLK